MLSMLHVVVADDLAELPTSVQKEVDARASGWGKRLMAAMAK
tara:strand:+ start:266 stop:391 length:126 start_codon:yes stop_codon:yes gene_type:complete